MERTRAPPRGVSFTLLAALLALASAQPTPVLRYSFEDGQGNQITDSMGNMHLRTTYNVQAVAPGTSPLNVMPIWASGSSCMKGGCIYFPGAAWASNYTAVSSVLPSGGAARTVSVWVFPTNTTRYMTLR